MLVQANILIDKNLRVRLADFGLALFADSMMIRSHSGGAQRWACPNVTIRRPDYTCDVYSYGCDCVEVSRCQIVSALVT